jgi:hypothetical protein
MIPPPVIPAPADSEYARKQGIDLLTAVTFKLPSGSTVTVPLDPALKPSP